MSAIESIKKHGLIPVSQWNKYHSWPNIKQMRNLRYQFLKEHKEFKNLPFIKDGFGRIWIDDRKFFEWAQDTGYIFRMPRQ